MEVGVRWPLHGFGPKKTKVRSFAKQRQVTADQILQRLAGYCTTINQNGCFNLTAHEAARAERCPMRGRPTHPITQLPRDCEVTTAQFRESCEKGRSLNNPLTD